MEEGRCTGRLDARERFWQRDICAGKPGTGRRRAGVFLFMERRAASKPARPRSGIWNALRFDDGRRMERVGWAKEPANVNACGQPSNGKRDEGACTDSKLS